MAKPSNPSPKKQKVEEAPAAVNGDAKTNGTTGSQLDQLKAHTVVVADTGDIESIKLYKPTDATTNPSLILASASNAAYKHLIDEAVKFSKEHFAEYSLDHFAKASRGRKKSGTKVAEATPEELLSLALDKVAVNFGCEILKTVSGVVSTEVDARLSFDVETSVLRAKRIIKLYEDAGVEKERILIKLASTWEGFLAAKELKKLDIKCNLTLLFSFYQAVAAAEAGVELISPFVGRIRDWYMTNEPSLDISKAENDPGCVSVKKIYNYYKKFGYDTIVMGASFRTKEEILELAGCDKLTIAPKFLQELQESTESVILKLNKEKVESEITEKIHLEEKDFRWFMNEDKMATDKLAEGIRNFAKDIEKLEVIIKPML